MTKIKISFFALAFVFAAGAAFANNGGIQDGWYVPDYTPGASPSAGIPSECNDGEVQCATLYLDGAPAGLAFKSND